MLQLVVACHLAQIFEEKRLSGQLRRQLSTLKEGLTSASQSADARRTECQALLERNLALEQELSETQGRLEGLRGDLKAAQGAQQELEARLRGSQERDPALEQQMKVGRVEVASFAAFWLAERARDGARRSRYGLC